MRDIYAHAAVASVTQPSDLTLVRTYLTERLDDLRETKKADLKKAFNMDPAQPKTTAEFIQWIKDGNFTVKADRMDKQLQCYLSPLTYITLGPAKDEGGYDKAKGLMDAAKADAKDVILCSDEATGLKTLQDFKSATFH